MYESVFLYTLILILCVCVYRQDHNMIRQDHNMMLKYLYSIYCKSTYTVIVCDKQGEYDNKHNPLIKTNENIVTITIHATWILIKIVHFIKIVHSP